MSESANGQKLKRIRNSKSYRDAYLSGHVRSGIAYQIQALREKLGLSQDAFARKIGTKQSVISRLENPEYGKVTVQTLIQVALALDVALLVRFCDYPAFLVAISDISPKALAVDSIYESKDVIAPYIGMSNRSLMISRTILVGGIDYLSQRTPQLDEKKVLALQSLSTTSTSSVVATIYASPMEKADFHTQRKTQAEFSHG